MSGEAVNNLQSNESESELDWSMSQISAVSGFDPAQYTREASCVSTPDIALPLGKDELDQLIQNVQGLRSSLVTISEKTVTPVNSPRADSTRFNGDKTPETAVKKSLSMTPPVKDPGPDSNNSRLEQMRKALKNLEDARSQYRHPRKSLDFSLKSAASVGIDKNDLILEKDGQIEGLKTKNAILSQECQKLTKQIAEQNLQINKLEHDLGTKHKLVRHTINVNGSNFLVGS